MRYKIKHPMADTISVVNHSLAYAGKNSSEVAFFHKGEWVVTPIEPFADYHDGSDSDSAVYGWVPNKLIDAFLADNGV
jgi:hypothetical protein